jgi:MFS family permease
MVLTVLGGGMGMSVMAFVPLYLVDQFGVSKQTAASLLSIVNFAGLWAGPVGGYISDRIGRVRIIIACGLISGILVYTLRLVPWGLGFGAVLFLIGINNSLRMPVSEAFIIGQTTARSRSTIYGIYYFAMQEASAVFAPIMGSLIDNLGFPACFTIASSVGIAITLICSVFLWGAQN